MEKLRLAVVFGGKSSEYPVSLHSAGSLIHSLHKEKYELILIGISENGEWYAYDGDIESIEHDHWLPVPPYSLSSKVLEVVEQYRQRLLEDWRKVSKKPIDLNFRIHTPCFRLWLEQGNFTCFSVRFTEEGVKIICPRNVDFSLPEVQRLVRNAIIRAMKKNAQEYLPSLLSALSEQYHLPFKRVKITGSKGRWGSCSGTGSINLSCYLMLLPPHLMDYVLLHELSHTKEMNHGPRFWELLDSMTGGRARALRAELRRFNTDF